MIDWILDFRFNTPLAVLLYWLPLAICVVGYTLRTARDYRKDSADRDSEKYYFPTLTLGTIIGRAIVSLIPVANLWAASFDVGYDMLRGFFSWIGRLFDQPLVPKRKE